jgi:RNA polymerase II subunit A C-terminal domain phosphatase
MDYTGFSDASRATIQMSHSANGPTVSLEEAQRLERETADHLLKTRKLSLIVDLDQTIVHATVDPTVGEWIAEGEAWEARQVAKTQKEEQAEQAEEGGSTTPPPPANGDSHEGDDDGDEVNPNWEALKDVKKFRLAPELFVPHGHHRGPQRDKSKPHVADEGCLYYIKPRYVSTHSIFVYQGPHGHRPGWQEFLRQTATKYEMHVYTMGTRAYAESVCAAIDPDRKIFGGRILSRDESGSEWLPPSYLLCVTETDKV